MILLLPPSETKRDGGGQGSRLQLGALSWPSLTAARKQALAALRGLPDDDELALAALRLSPRQLPELARNRTLAQAPTMPAIERYTGVLFDALDAGTLGAAARAFAGRHLVIHSALFGLLRGDDPIPAYRLSHDSRLPGLSLRTLWRQVIPDALATTPGLVIDLRSDSYIALGPAPAGAVTVRVVSEDASGRRTALSHFNKAAKGRFARALAEAGIVHESAQSLVSWALGQGIRLEHHGQGVLELIT